VFVKGLITFAAGLVGFLSPCVLPLLPGYVGFMTGASAGEKVPVRKALPGTLAFVGGLTVVFVSLGATASVLSEFLHEHKRGIELVGGAFIVVLGLLMVFGDRFAFLLRERRFRMRPKAGVVPTFFLGAAFAFGWTPCIGPTLGAALNLAATSDGLASGIGLLFAYSLGIGLPFLLAGLGLMTFGGRLKRHAATIRLVGGVILVGVGLLMLTGRLTEITIRANDLFGRLNIDFWNF
jgi:cytochrome c-type biogenesis protein